MSVVNCALVEATVVPFRCFSGSLVLPLESLCFILAIYAVPETHRLTSTMMNIHFHVILAHGEFCLQH